MTKDESAAWFNSIESDHFEHLKLELAHQLDMVIQRSGLKRREVAERMGTSPAWVTKVLRGDANPTLETMERLAEACEYRVHIHIAPKGLVGVWTEVQTNPTTPLANIVPHALPAYEVKQTFFGLANATIAPRNENVARNFVIGGIDG
ncbi:helix-turn-helix transcriptional regulator [Paraburkholderia sediminicola]|uniref:helix-turn-helix domain-containing protein n=1 Tax=Paraburkholderia sediminicola TaxID=458836 RepID=UPI0038BC6F27